jgi:predicted RNase H-like HicB family nuclease
VYRRDEDKTRASRVAEGRATYESAPLRDSLHATVSRGEEAYVAECWEVAVVTQGRTLDEVVSNLREALTLHLEGEDLGSLGLAPSPRLVVAYESPLENGPSAQTTLG